MYLKKIILFLAVLGFSCCVGSSLVAAPSARPLLLPSMGSQGVWASVVGAGGLRSGGSRALEHRLSSSGTRAQLLRGRWDLSGPGIKPASPALAGRFFTTEPPGKSPNMYFLKKQFVMHLKNCQSLANYNRKVKVLFSVLLVLQLAYFLHLIKVFILKPQR